MQKKVELVCLGGQFLAIIGDDGKSYFPERKVSFLTQSGKWLNFADGCVYQQKLYYVIYRNFESQKCAELNLLSFDLETSEEQLVKRIEMDREISEVEGLEQKDDHVDFGLATYSFIGTARKLRYPLYRYSLTTGTLELLNKDKIHHWGRNIINDFQTKYVPPLTPSDYYENLK